MLNFDAFTSDAYYTAYHTHNPISPPLATTEVPAMCCILQNTDFAPFAIPNAHRCTPKTRNCNVMSIPITKNITNMPIRQTSNITRLRKTIRASAETKKQIAGTREDRAKNK